MVKFHNSELWIAWMLFFCMDGKLCKSVSSQGCIIFRKPYTFSVTFKTINLLQQQSNQSKTNLTNRVIVFVISPKGTNDTVAHLFHNPVATSVQHRDVRSGEAEPHLSS